MIDIDISKALKNEGECGTFSYEGVPELGGDIDFAQPLELEAEFCVTDKKVSVTGNFDAVLNTVCDRCLTGMTTDVGYRFSELYWPEGTGEEEEYTYKGDTLSLDKMVYDAIVLSLPQQFLCKEDCKGICPQCGQDLNAGSCECKQGDTDETNPFAKLKGLF